MRMDEQLSDQKQQSFAKAMPFVWQPPKAVGAEVIRIPAGTALNCYWGVLAREQFSK